MATRELALPRRLADRAKEDRAKSWAGHRGPSVGFIPILVYQLRRVWREIMTSQTPPEEYALPLREVFGQGLPIETDDGQHWLAFGEQMDLERRQVSLRVRLEPAAASSFGKQPHVTMTTKRPAPEAPLPRRVIATPQPTDPLILQYSFLVTVPLDENLALFTEYAGNELRRLRPGPDREPGPGRNPHWATIADYEMPARQTRSATPDVAKRVHGEAAE